MTRVGSAKQRSFTLGYLVGKIEHSMALSAAERSRRYREKKKQQGLYEDMKQKHREQQQK